MAHLAVTQSTPPCDYKLESALRGLDPDAPIVIMLHGFKYDPADPARDPQRQIYAYNPDRRFKRVASWPRRLGLQGRKGLAIGFGWHASGTIWQAHAQAACAAKALAALICRIRAQTPHRPIHIVAHSLGARVAVSALSALPCGTVSRVILIAAAVFEHELKSALGSPVGGSTEIINIRSRANTLFDLLLRAALPHWGPTVGRGRLRHQKLLDVNIDCQTMQSALTSAGFSLSQSQTGICHWSGYLRKDVCAFYRRLLHSPALTPLAYLQSVCDIVPQMAPHATVNRSLSFRGQMR